MLILVSFGSGLAFLLALASFINKGKEFYFRNLKSEKQSVSKGTNENFWLRQLQQNSTSILFVSVGIVQLHLYLELSEELKNVPWFAEIHVPFIFLIGPLTYLYFEKLSGAKEKNIQLLHFLPFFLVLVILFPFYLENNESKIFFLENQAPEDPSHGLVTILLIFGTLSNFLYPATLFWNVWRWRKETAKNLREVFSPFLFLFAYTLTVLFLFLIAQIFYMPLFVISANALTILISTIFLMSATQTSVIENFQKESREARYKESRVSGLDVDLILKRLNDLMKIERVFLDENLTLVKLSNLLQIHTHQLSEILNTRLQLTFREYVTQFRLEEAAKLLKEEPERSVLSILYSSGFNSKSAFHKLFQERFGCSPSSYRSDQF
ncbi:AraC family transcriptional regulator [Leptospira stimsonii]|uniref:AraC family transcriptional regulator n=1 Tax=Leptospira stimsonii TaxID=2202203 RepID=A0A8B6RZ67_9LEPT|nr:helix-turn-helix domain-containing protein [Leptospira stimsonii]RHX87951.1 AraC family transcriptional regulator [Leptospira stimsonii]